MENQLRTLIEKYKPTKYKHNYEGAYWMYFKDIRFAVKSVLEIGVDKGDSLLMWREFFPNARIMGIDLNPECKKYEDQANRICIRIGDQSDEVFLNEINKMAGGFDIIIDDGSHQYEHQIKTFETLFPLMRSSGIYVIEDIMTDWKDYPYFSDLIRNLNYQEPVESWDHSSYFKEGNYFDNNICGLYYGRYCCFVIKGHNPDNPYLTIL